MTRSLASDQPDREVLAGIVERVTFHDAETGFCVLRVKGRGHRDLATVVGHAATISPAEWITASGDWVNDRNHGLQFKARSLFLARQAGTRTAGKCGSSRPFSDIELARRDRQPRAASPARCRVQIDPLLRMGRSASRF
jgi:hypothetical protein